MRRRVRFLALFALLCGLVLPVRAGRIVDATPHLADGWIAVDVRARDLLDDRTRSTVESGLPGSCRLLVELRDASDRLAARRAVERVLEFDLWEGIARVRDGRGETVFGSIAAADSAWSRFLSIRIAPVSRLDATRPYRVFLRVEVESFGSEERARVSRYVSDTADGERREVAFDLGRLVGELVGSDDEDDEVWRGPSFVPAELDSIATEPDA